ncbi:tyrosinase [Cubamyces sp. BRFM 1775]|nr:tyrosinase [Cubamyces sp. BRFM 1775]
MPQSTLLTTGPLGGETPGAAAPNRMEINDFVKDEKMFSLYIQALQAMMDTPQDEPDSFFQIAGIHGLPYVSWNGVGEESSAEAAGYCTHSSVLFPTWHRPYVSLFEQIIQKHAIRIAEQYVTDVCCWRKAAEDVRQPYWEWAKFSIPPPEVVSLQKVAIQTSDGRRTLVRNPLLRYRFQPVDPSFLGSFAKWPTTIRYPTSTSPAAKDDVKRLLEVLQANQTDLRSKTYALLTRARTWPDFSCNAAGDGHSTANSLEAIHDSVHDAVGGTGHMGDPAYAGFDPIFMMHHCQVDRLLSLWSALNPDLWVSEASETGGTFTIPPRSAVNEHTALTPFRCSEEGFWSSSDVAGLCPTQLGYSYPDFNGLDLDDKASVAMHIAEVVNELYAPQIMRRFLPPRMTPHRRDRRPIRKSAHSWHTGNHSAVSTRVVKAYTVLEVPVADDELMDGYLVLVPEPPRNFMPDLLWEWTVRIRVKKYTLGRSFSVLIFLGSVPEHPDEWITSPTYVGAHHAFVNSVPQRCANCVRRTSVTIEGFVHLNEAISRHTSAHFFEPEVMKWYLQRELSWRVRRMDGSLVDPDSLESLEVAVFAQPLTSPEYGSSFFASGAPEYYPEITDDHIGGSYIGL